MFLLEKRRELIEQLQGRARTLALSHGTEKKKHSYTLEDFIGTAPAVLELKKTIRKVAPQDSNIMITGKPATARRSCPEHPPAEPPEGKAPGGAELCRRSRKPHRKHPVRHRAGAYTGSTNRKGLLEAAHEGTLFLDELNSMSPAMQAKLLRVLQEGVFRRVGETREREVDVRVISTCNRDPFQLVRTGKIREDLFYRLATLVLQIPPLRDRIDDLEPCATPISAAVPAGTPIL